MKIQEIKFKNKSDKYSIFIGENTLSLLPKKIKFLCPKTKKIGIIFDKNLPVKFKKKLINKLRSYDVSFFTFEVVDRLRAKRGRTRNRNLHVGIVSRMN